MCILGKIFGQTCLKFSRDFFFNMRSVIRWGTGRINFMAKSICSRRRVQTFCLSGGSPTPILSISGATRSLHKKNPVQGSWSTYSDDFEKMSETVFFQSNKVTACKIKEYEEVVNFLKVFHLLKIIHLF